MTAWDVSFAGPVAGPLAQAIAAQDAGHGEAAAAAPGPVVLIDAGDDMRTIAELARVLADGAGASAVPQIVAQIQQPALRHAVETRLESDGIAPRPQIVSVPELLARHFISARPLHQRAVWRGQRRVHAVLLGFGALGRALIDEIVLDGIAEGLERPLITILMPEGSAAARDVASQLDRDMPEIAASAEISVKPLDRAEIGDPAHSPLVVAETAAAVTAIFILLDEAEEVLQAGIAVSDLQDRHGRAVADLFVGGPHATTALAVVLPRRSDRNIGREIAAIGGLDAIPDVLATILVGRDLVARRVHAAYQAKYGAVGSAGRDWERLGETYRRANRRAARHLAQKLSALGIDVSRDPQRLHLVVPAVMEGLILPLVRSASEDRAIRGLARLEHERWCADRRLDGWVHGVRRDDARRTHPSLVPFDDPRLTAQEIEKDIDQLRFLLGFVVEAAPTGAALRFTIGILAATGQGQPGVPLAAVIARLAQETDRAAVLIAPMRTPDELAATTAILAHLTASGRGYRIVVPELTGGQPLAFVDEATMRRRGEILAGPATFIVSIGPAAPSDLDDWEDGTAIDAEADAIVDYVLARSDVLLEAGGTVV